MRSSTDIATPAPAPRIRRPARPGTRNAWSERESMKRSSRSGASRKSSALRLGGVSSTRRSKSPTLVELVEALHRHVLLRARDGRGQLAVDPVAQHRLPRLLVGGVAAHHVVERALGIEHQRPQLALHLDAGRLEPRRVHQQLLVPQLRHAQGLGQAPRRIDRDDRDLPGRARPLRVPARPPSLSCRRRRSPRRRRPACRRAGSQRRLEPLRHRLDVLACQLRREDVGEGDHWAAGLLAAAPAVRGEPRPVRAGRARPRPPRAPAPTFAGRSRAPREGRPRRRR